MRKNTIMVRCLSLLLALCLVLQFAPAGVLAADEELPGNDELFAMYVEQTLYGYEWATFGTAARENLNTAEQAIYDALKPQIEAVAASGGTTAFVLNDVSGLKMEWTREELGVESIEDLSAVQAQFAAQFDLSKILTALLSDCPYDLYWYDKTKGTSVGYSYSRSGQSVDGTTYWTSITIKNLTFTFTVASAYQGGDTSTVTTDVSKVSTAKTNAQAVVDANASATDYEKLVAYKEAICEMVSYNDEAAADDYTGGYGDPWQLIYVFDGDDTTKVVCEGYAKAFQYLCDLGGLDCISVSGVMAGGTGAGGHMWNIVTLDGQNYLVDVTNCDEGTIGAPDLLFLVGNSTGSVADGYVFALNGQNISFTYDSDILSTWTEAELTLAASDYEPAADQECTHSYENGTCTLCGDVCAHDYADGVCTVCGAGVFLNTATGVYYASLDGALNAAAADQTIQLQHDAAQSKIMVYPGLTLDLNGHQLTADYVVAFETAHVIDGAGKGRLVVEMNQLILDAGNNMVPVYDGTGYLFTKTGFTIDRDETYTGDGFKVKALACPLAMEAVELLKDGGSDNNIQIMILLSWDTAEGTGTQQFVFTDAVTGSVYTSNNGSWASYAKMFTMTITGFASIENLRANIVMVSGTGVEYVSTVSVDIS